MYTVSARPPPALEAGRGERACVRALSHPDHPNLKLLGFRVVYPPNPPIKGGIALELPSRGVCFRATYRTAFIATYRTAFGSAAWSCLGPPGAAWGRLGPPGAAWGRLGLPGAA